MEGSRINKDCTKVVQLDYAIGFHVPQARLKQFCVVILSQTQCGLLTMLDRQQVPRTQINGLF